jgi:16S rRNA (uracil1498-N3)-methyltransferase
MTTRFFVDRVEGDRVLLGKGDSHHLLRVMRAQPGDDFTVLVGGVQYECRLTGVGEGHAEGTVVASRPASGEPPVKVTLFQGLAKGDKLETVIQHGTEIGISEFVPVASRRSVVKLEPKKAAERVERWQRIAREAAEQSRRGAVPRVAPVASWQEAVARCGEFELALVPWEEGGEPLGEVLKGAPGTRSVALFIGPEGGLSPEEVAQAGAHGARAVTLGPRILRTETAGLAAAVAILFALGDLG